MIRLMGRLILRMAVCVLIIGLLWAGGLIWFVRQMPERPGTSTVSTDAIVVLTGGSGRIEYGMELLAAGRARKLFISGVEGAVSPERLIARSSPEIALRVEELRVERGRGGAENVVMLGFDARNTIGNAAEARRWMREQGLKSLRLVTASYHMPRALLEFRFALPDARIVPDPVFPADFKQNSWWHDATSFHLVMREYHKYIAAHLRHALILAADEGEG